MWRLIGIALFAAGIMIAQLGIGTDYLLPVASPGVNLPQLLIVGFGLALAGAAALLRPEHVREESMGARRRLLTSASLVTLFTLLALEIALTAMGMPTYFPQELRGTDYHVLSWITCDEDGCRMNYEEIIAQCATGELTGRHCIVNRQGYPNLNDFVVREDFDRRFRIITVGDSFTHGFSADIGKSYVEYLEATIPEVEIWNLGIGGTGTIQDLQAYVEFAPAFQPQLSILGFYMNDFSDNLSLNFHGMQLRDSDGNIHFPRYPQKDRWGRPIQLSQDLVMRYAVAGSKPPVNDLEARLGTTRLGTIALQILDRAGRTFFDRSFERQVETTRQYLTQLRDAVSSLDSGFLVLLIPRREDIGDSGEVFANAIMLMEELDIHYLNPTALLTVEDYALQPDVHWNNAGHQKIGKLLSDCIQRFRDSGSLDDCADVTMP